MHRLGHSFLAFVHFRKETYNISLKITLLAVGYPLKLNSTLILLALMAGPPF